MRFKLLKHYKKFKKKASNQTKREDMSFKSNRVLKRLPPDCFYLLPPYAARDVSTGHSQTGINHLLRG